MQQLIVTDDRRSGDNGAFALMLRHTGNTRYYRRRYLPRNASEHGQPFRRQCETEKLISTDTLRKTKLSRTNSLHLISDLS